MDNIPTSILAFRNGSIGNTLAAVPALRALRRNFPAVPLSVVVDPVGYALLSNCPWIDHLIIYDKRGADRGLLAHIQLVRRLRAERPSHAVLFKRFFRNGMLSYLSGATIRAGFNTAGRAPFLNRTIPYEEGVSVVDLNLRLAELLGAAPAGRELEIFLNEKDLREAEELLGHYHLQHGEYVVAHYGGLTTAPDFVPLPRFAALLQAAAKDRPVLLLGSGASEAHYAELLRAQYPALIPLCGTPLRTSGALLKYARLFFGFNSGPAHLAAAAGTPSIVLFRDGPQVTQEIRKWSPPSKCSRPLIPPAKDIDSAWDAFRATLDVEVAAAVADAEERNER